MLVHQPHRVYIRESWLDAWVEEPYLYAERITWTCAPSIGSAELSYRFGRIQQYGQLTKQEYSRLFYSNHFVKIEVDQEDEDARVWYGVITEDGRDVQGTEVVPTGTQRMTALGLEYLLARKVLTESVMRDASGAEHYIGRAIAFNMGGGNEVSAYAKGNKSNDVGDPGGGVYPFQSPSETGDVWSGVDIVKYLLAYHAPADGIGNIRLPWDLDETIGESQAGNLRFLFPVIQVHGRTLFDILNMIIDRRRLLSWRVVVSDETALIRVFSFNRDLIVLPSFTTISPNGNQVNWDFGTDEKFRAVAAKSTTNQYQQVITRGERRGTVMTISDATSTLEADWTSSQETAYDAGGGTSGDPYLKELRHIQYRASDALKRVYRYFRLPIDFTGQISGQEVNPDPLGAGEPFWYRGLRFAPRLPLKKDHDYTGTKISAGTVTNTLPEGAEAEFLEPFVVIETEGSRYWQIDQLGRSSNYEGTDEGGGFQWSAAVRMQDEAPGIVVDVRGEAQHVIASADFTPADSDDLLPEPMLDWRDMRATVYCQFDSYATGIYPEVASGDDDVFRILEIDMPGLRLDYVVPGTVVGISSAGALLTSSSGGYLNDDRSKLNDLARIAYEWYSTPRQVLDVTIHTQKLDSDLDVGTLILNLGSGSGLEVVNTVLTELTITTRDPGTLMVKTAFAELDVASV